MGLSAPSTGKAVGATPLSARVRSLCATMGLSAHHPPLPSGRAGTRRQSRRSHPLSARVRSLCATALQTGLDTPAEGWYSSYHEYFIL